MKLREYEGKELFKKYGIRVPNSILITGVDSPVDFTVPAVLKAQVLSGDRKKAGGIVFVDDKKDIQAKFISLIGKDIDGEKVDKILVEEKIVIAEEYYASISYDTMTRGPVIALSKSGGSGIKKAKTYPIDIRIDPLPSFLLRQIIIDAGFKYEDVSGLSAIISSLWSLFLKEYALLAEINPIFKTREGLFIAGDAKVIIDDEKINPNEKRFVQMGGDIAILASGGGASMLNMDYLLKHGGRPANYTEYSGNPKSDVVKDLTRRVLEQENINGCWVVGGTANFTDIYETLKGFTEGLQGLSYKPKYPIVIRRDGPRQKEAKLMIEKFAVQNGYDIRIYGNELSMEDSAKIMVKLAKEYSKKS